MPPERIICLTEEWVEFLYLLGEEARIAGIPSHTKRPPRAKQEKPVVSSFLKGNIQKIIELQPDLILGFSDLQAELAKELIRNHLNVFITNARSLEEIFKNLYWAGMLLDKKEKTETLIQGWREKLQYYREKTQNQKRKFRVFFMEWDDPVIGGIGWVEELLEILNTEPVFPELKTKKSAKERIVSKEEIISRNPDILINCWCGKPADFEWINKEFADTSAVKNRRVYEIPPEIILQPGPALFEEGIDVLYKIIYN